eukprot:TRINITY_DN84_c0_g1_i1.p1 TRINITY_DN84_c0_g1~~TRINITY_DN84_c0_g1_i1.p1  ORF type:complete len:448 (-),score=187.20 TRINITY_DN84_c0_g1_i1:93-1364(-)
MKIYSYAQNPKVYKALVAAQYVGQTIETPEFNFGVDNKTPEFLKKNPLGKVPVLETDDGQTIWESNAIARYVARLNPNVRLYGANAYESALVDQWVDFTVGEIELPAYSWLLPIEGYIPNNPVATSKAIQDIRKVLSILNNHLANRTFLVGERVTLADICVALSLLKLYELVLDPGFRKPFPNTNRWFLTLVNQPQFHAVIGDFKICEKQAQAGGEGQKQQQPKEPKQPKQPKQPAQPKEKPQPKEKEKEPENEEEDYEEKPKGKNPLDLLPKSALDLEEWKRVYSNQDTRTQAIPWLWSHYDPAGYSLWFAIYKYPNELESVLYACNLAGGFIQRLERLRKYGFASLIIFGNAAPDLALDCLFLVRGTELPFEVTDCPDYESYEWKRIDINDAQQKTWVENFLAWDGAFPNGKALNQGKVFK